MDDAHLRRPRRRTRLSVRSNPALGDWLSRESLLATAPPKTSEAHWRRVRLIQWRATNFEPVLPVGLGVSVHW